MGTPKKPEQKYSSHFRLHNSIDSRTRMRGSGKRDGNLIGVRVELESHAA
jgi:hypothetical protein